MSILYDEKQKTLTLHTKNTTYQMQVDRYGFLLHLYYGKRADGCMDYLLTFYDRGFSGNPYDAGKDKTYSMDALPQEIPVARHRGLQDACLHHQEHGPHIQQRFPVCEPQHQRGEIFSERPAGSVRGCRGSTDAGSGAGGQGFKGAGSAVLRRASRVRCDHEERKDRKREQRTRVGQKAGPGMSGHAGRRV